MFTSPFKIRISSLYHYGITKLENDLVYTQVHDEDRQPIINILNFWKTDSKAVDKEEGRGEIDENIISCLKGVRKDVCDTPFHLGLSEGVLV